MTQLIPAHRAILERLQALPRLALWSAPTPVDPLVRLREALGGGATLLAKRDDAIPFGFGGNKVRKLQIVTAAAQRAGADTLITCGGVQSNHARATAAVAARLGMRCVLIANGSAQPRPTANALLNRVLGAEVQYVASRQERAPAMETAAERLRVSGGRPFVIPIGASTALGAAAYALAVGELLAQIDAPDVIVHATSSGGTQAGLVAGCKLHGLHTRVIGISADDPSDAVQREVRRVLTELETLLEVQVGWFSGIPLEVDDTFVGKGYGIPSAASNEAIELSARTDGLFVDSTYTAKAMAGLIARVRAKQLVDGTVLFWHTGGQVGLFA
jgi:1-aminocyclopropane-1-carboxylate deaminase/D-cysteine desulfhydrase-like pyridoxal-dependent ACC family enzyme